MDNKVFEFLKESNAIEGVFDDDSLEQAIIAWEYLSKCSELTVHDILATHKLLMVNQPIPEDAKGSFRKIGVIVGGREGMNHWDIRPYITEWVKKANEDSRWKDIKLSHVAYEYCHPFYDGNGRTGRMFMNWSRLKNGMKVKIIKAENRNEYYKWFN